MNTPIDEREGWTSASAADADALCPGRHMAQRGLPELPKGEDCERGTRIHEWLAAKAKGVALPELSADELEIAERCWLEACETIVATECLCGELTKSLVEERLWVSFGALRHSGKPDYVGIFGGTHALVIDHKTGRGDVPESPSNLQLRDLAMLVAINEGVRTVDVAIIQPLAGKPVVTRYEWDDLSLAYTETKFRVMASNSPDSPRVAGEVQCQYCRARATCPAASPTASALIPVATDFDVATLAPDKLADMLTLCDLAEDTLTARVTLIREEARKRIEADPAAVPGWELKPGAEREKITNAQLVWTRCDAEGVPDWRFNAAVTLTKSGIETALRETLGLKGRELKEKVKEVCAGATESTTTKPTLRKTKT